MRLFCCDHAEGLSGSARERPGFLGLIQVEVAELAGISDRFVMSEPCCISTRSGCGPERSSGPERCAANAGTTAWSAHLVHQGEIQDDGKDHDAEKANECTPRLVAVAQGETSDLAPEAFCRRFVGAIQLVSSLGHQNLAGKGVMTSGL